MPCEIVNDSRIEKMFEKRNIINLFFKYIFFIIKAKVNKPYFCKLIQNGDKFTGISFGMILFLKKAS